MKSIKKIKIKKNFIIYTYSIIYEINSKKNIIIHIWMYISA